MEDDLAESPQIHQKIIDTLNLPEIPKEQKRSRKDFDIISKPSEDSNPIFITADVIDTRLGGKYKYIQLKSDYLNDIEILQNLKSMLQVMYNTDHPSINHPYAFIPGSPQDTFKDDTESLFAIYPQQTKSSPMIVFSIMKNRNIKSFQAELTMMQKFIILYGIAASMNYLHKKNMSHLNLNPENVLLNNQLEPVINIDITSKPKSVKKDPFYRIPSLANSYVSPELLNRKKSRETSEIDEEKADVYSFGMITYFLFTGLEPSNSSTERSSVENLIPHPFDELIQECRFAQQLKRPTFKDILNRIVSSDFIRTVEEFDISMFKKYQKKVVDEEFVFPIQLHSDRKIEDFDEGKMIGTGISGSVRLAIDKTNGVQIALKKIKYNENSQNDKFVDREIQILSSIDFPSIVPYYGLIKPEGERKDTIILFPWATNCDLERVLKKESSNQKPCQWTYTQKCIVLYGIAMGMYKLHEINVIHRDLKPQNILINQNFEPWITDFGLSKYVDQSQEMFQSTTVGTTLYMAPETFAEEDDGSHKYDGKRADVYSFGVLVYYLMAGIQPWKNSTNRFTLIANVLKGERPEIPENVSESIKKLIELCWDQNPKQRPTFKKIVEMISEPDFFRDPKREFNDYQLYKYQVKLGELDFIKYKKSSDNDDDLDAFVSYALCLKNGAGVKKNEEEAIRLMSTAAEKDNVDAQIILANWYIKEKPRKYGLAYEILKKAEAKNHPDAAALIGTLMEKRKLGKLYSKDDILNMYKKSCNMNSPEGMYHMATLYHYGDQTKSSEAICLYYLATKNVNANKGPAAFSLSVLYEEIGNNYKAFSVADFYRKQDMFEGIARCADLYERGIGVQKNDEKAAELYEIAKQPRFAQEQMAIGLLYSRGKGVKRSKEKAFYWTEISANNGSATGQANLAIYYMNGFGCQKDLNKAEEYGLKSAEQNNAHAYIILARINEKNGNHDKAILCLEKAAELGNGRSLVDLGKKYKEMKRYNDAIKCFKDAADNRVPSGLFFYGNELISGRHTKKNVNDGVDLMEMAAEMRCKEPIRKLKNIYSKGKGGIKPDPAKVQKYQEILDKFPRHKPK